MKPGILKAGKWLLNALLPRACLHCGLDLHYLWEAPLCPACAGALEMPPTLSCARCGLPLEGGGASCPDCRGRGGALTLARAAFIFNPQLRSAVHAFKYRAREDLADWLAGEMAAALKHHPELGTYNFCAAVPLHKARLRGRGFNQAELLAEKLAARANLFHLKGAAQRLRDTPSQTELSKAARKANMAGAFAAGALAQDRNILLIDDVATTLATLESLADAFKKAGARSVAAFTLAREP
jgi:ComF family protein